jgi:hypothetical protein
MDPEIERLTAELATYTLRNTVEAVSGRIRATKARKQDAETINELTQIINELIEDKAEITRAAQGFRDKLIAQQLGDADIEYITTNVVPLIKKLAEASGNAGQTEQTMDLLAPLLSVHTVKVLQLLGFNFREAIGQPLTKLIAGLIQSKTQPSNNIEELERRRQIALYEVAQDEHSTQRLRDLTGQ